MADEYGQNQQTRENPGAGGDGGDSPRAPKRSRTRRWLLFALVPVAAAVVASAVVLPRAAAWGGWHPGFRGFGHGHGDPSSPEGRERLQRRLTFVLDQLDADEQQQAAIRAIVDRSLGEMAALHEQGHALRDRFGAALLGEQVDRQELEQARQQLRELTDQGSRLAVKRLAEISEVLTPEQRTRVYDFIEAMHR
jgi:Spy/CpxP family protein refolding chaperone